MYDSIIMEDRLDFSEWLSDKEYEQMCKLMKEMTQLNQAIEVEKENEKPRKETNTRLETARKTLLSKEQMLQRLIVERDMLNEQINRVTKIIESSEEAVERETALLQKPVKSKKHIELEIKRDDKQKQIQRIKETALRNKESGSYTSPEEIERRQAKAEAAKEKQELDRKEAEEKERKREEAERERKAREQADIERQRKKREIELSSRFKNDTYTRAWTKEQEDEYLSSLTEEQKTDYEHLDAPEKDDRVENYFFSKNKKIAWQNHFTEIEYKGSLGHQEDDWDTEDEREAEERARVEREKRSALKTERSRPNFVKPIENPQVHFSLLQPKEPEMQKPQLVSDTKVKKPVKKVLSPTSVAH